MMLNLKILMTKKKFNLIKTIFNRYQLKVNLTKFKEMTNKNKCAVLKQTMRFGQTSITMKITKLWSFPSIFF